MKVVVIAEDFRKDQYILDPIIRTMLTYLGKPHAKLKVAHKPLPGGVTRAMDFDEISSIIELYQGMADLFLLCVDRDSEKTRREKLDNLEKKVQERFPSVIFLSENAWQELEVWALAGLDLPKDWSWQQVRAERDPKETYFKPIAGRRGLLAEPGEGRRTLGLEAAKRYTRIRQLCPEDIQALEERIKAACKT